MAEYIDREELLKDIEDSVRFSSRNGVSAEMRGATKIIDRIFSAPTVDVDEVVHGRWETRMLGDDVGTDALLVISQAIGTLLIVRCAVL